MAACLLVRACGVCMCSRACTCAYPSACVCVQLMWTLPVEAAPLLWDSSINEDTSKGGVLRDSINKACQGPLPTSLSEVPPCLYHPVCAVPALGLLYPFILPSSSHLSLSLYSLVCLAL